MRINMLEALSDNISVDPGKCTACGACVDKCILDNLRLKLSPCRQACPLEVNCQGYVQLILRGQEEEALEMVERQLPFAGIMGRICSAPCESNCHAAKTHGDGVAIRALKRYVSDLADQDKLRLPAQAPSSGKHCAIVGAGPAGMLAAYDLLVQGHAVTLIDADPEPGGMLRWAIPEFRLPLAVLNREVSKLQAMGVEFQGGMRLGRDIQIEELRRNYDAVIVATGCPRSKKLDINGADAPNVYYALPFLRKIREKNPPDVGRTVIVIGGGDVALDAAQTALRLGAAAVSLVCLENAQQMPATPESLEMAVAEGVTVLNAWGLDRLLLKDGRVAGVALKKCLTVFDRDGAFAPTFDECVLQELDADSVILAVGQEPDKTPLAGVTGADPLTLQTEYENVFLAGDVASGASSVVKAMASGRRAAESVRRLFAGEHLSFGRSYRGPVETEYDIDTSRGSERPRVKPSWLAGPNKGDFREIEQGITAEQAREEAARCYSCGRPFGKFRTCWFCLPCEVECPQKALWVQIPYLLR